MEDVLPLHSITDEMCYLSSVLIYDGDRTELIGAVSVDDFYQDDHKVIFRAICGAVDAGRKIDGVVIRGELGSNLEAIGGLGYLSQVLDAAPSYHHWAEYARRVRELSAKRKLLALADGLRAAAMIDDPHSTADEIFTTCKKRFSDIEQSCSRSKPFSLSDAYMDYIGKLENGEERLLPIGIEPLDDAIGGILPGEIWMFGGRPSMGKSTVVRQAARTIASKGIPVGYFSLEENAEKVTRNILSMVSSIENNQLRRGIHSQDRIWSSIIDAAPKMNIPLYLETNARTIPQIRAAAASLINRCGIKVMVVDYLGLISGFRGSPYDVASQQSSGIADVAKSLNLALLMPVQLSRGNTGRDDKRPTMADIRDSGRIEQDADGIIFIHREDYYRQKDAGYIPNHITEFIIGKYRDGRRGQTVTMKSNLRYQRFEECAATENFTAEQCV